MKTLKSFIPYYKPYLGVFFFDMLCALICTGIGLVNPILIRQVLNEGLGSASPNMQLIFTVCSIMLGLAIVDAFSNYYISSTGHVMGSRMETDMRNELFAHLQKLPYSYYDNTKIGQLMSRITSDLFDVTEFAHHFPEELVISVISIIGSFIILSSINLTLTVIIFSVLPLMLIYTVILNKKMKKMFAVSRKQVGEINSQVEDSLLGIRVVKSFTNEPIENSKFAKGNNKFLKIKKKSYHYMGLFSSGIRFFDGFMYLTVVFAGAMFIFRSQITAADLVAYLLYITTLLASIRKLVEMTEQFQRGITGFERFTEILKTPINIKDIKNAKVLQNVKGEITFDNVTFRYDSGMADILQTINLHIKAGENVALVGESGGGKTTLCSLIPRFYEVSEGRITIDGQDIKSVTQKSLRDNIGSVQQDVYLFSGSILENIEYGRPGATKDEIITAAKLANAHEFICQLENDYDTYVGERGVKLSGGQKQRISIARVFLKNPPILILDEATSALDNESEYIVQKSLERLAQGRTTLTIAHRLTTVKNADRILVLTKNGIEEEGTHDWLMNKQGSYYNLYNMNFEDSL